MYYKIKKFDRVNLLLIPKSFLSKKPVLLFSTDLLEYLDEPHTGSKKIFTIILKSGKEITIKGKDDLYLEVTQWVKECVENNKLSKTDRGVGTLKDEITDGIKQVAGYVTGEVIKKVVAKRNTKKNKDLSEQ